MGTVIDTLQIFVEADARGIETTLKKVLATATGTVNQINKQEVDWTSIFTRSVTPAIISGVASMFAFAIAQSVQFQQAMLTTGTAAGESASQIQQTGDAALNLSKTVPASAADIAAAMAQVSAIFGVNTQATKDIVDAMTKLSTAGFGNLNDIVSASMDIFRQWGVTTSDDAVSVLTSLMHGAEGARESIPQLAAQFGQVSPPLIQAGVQLTEFNGILSSFSSEIKNIGAASTLAMFQSIADGASNAASPVAIFGGGVEAIRKSLKDNGGLDVIKKLSDVFSTQFGNNVGLIAKNFGMSATEVEGLINSGRQFPTISKDASEIAKNAQTIGQAFDQSNGVLNKLSILWNHFKADATNVGSLWLPLGSGFVGVLDTMIGSADKFFKNLTDGIANVINDIGSAKIGNAFTDSLKTAGGALKDVFITAPTNFADSIFGSLGIPTSSDINLNRALGSSGVGFTSDILSRIDKTAEQSGVMDALLSALQSNNYKGGNATLNNVFHLNVPSGSSGLTAKMIAQQLYNQFQGTSY